MTERYPFAKDYLAMVRKAFAVTARGGIVRMSWAGPDLDAEGWRREFMGAMDRRINVKGGLVQKGRKWDCDYQRNLRHDARAINTPRLRIYSITTPELRKRFAHRISRWDD